MSNAERTAGVVSGAVLTPHARLRMHRRGIPESIVRAVLAFPEVVEYPRPGRLVAQAQKTWEGEQKSRLVRVVVDIDRSPAEVVTVYATSKFARYASQS